MTSLDAHEEGAVVDTIIDQYVRMGGAMNQTALVGSDYVRSVAELTEHAKKQQGDESVNRESYQQLAAITSMICCFFQAMLPSSLLALLRDLMEA